MDISGANSIGALDDDKRKPSMTDEEIYNALKQLPDFDRFPLPAYWYDKFNIPKPKIPTFKEALTLHYATQNAPGDGKSVEIRDVAPGGVRPLLDAPVVEVTTEHIADEPTEAR